MDEELEQLLKRAQGVELSEAELEEHRIALAAANGHLSDPRITLETMQAARTMMLAAEQPKEEKEADEAA